MLSRSRKSLGSLNYTTPTSLLLLPNILLLVVCNIVHKTDSEDFQPANDPKSNATMLKEPKDCYQHVYKSLEAAWAHIQKPSYKDGDDNRQLERLEQELEQELAQADCVGSKP